MIVQSKVFDGNKCDICSGKKNPYRTSHDDRYGYPGDFVLTRCVDCKHIALNQKFSSKELADLYTNYYPRKSFNVDLYEPYTEEKGFSSWLNGLKCSAFRWVPKNVRVLDIGCGFGQTLGYHISRGCDVYGVEADENIRRVIDKHGYKVHVGLFESGIYEANYFDYLTMDQVIEHVVDPQVTLNEIAEILKPGGFAILSTPNCNGWGANLFRGRWINWHSPYHLQFFSKKSMQIIADGAGLQIVDIKTITHSDWLLYQLIHLIFYPDRGKVSDFWLPSKHKKTFLQRLILKFLYLFHKTKFNHLITRIFDILGVGDNFLIILKKI